MALAFGPKGSEFLVNSTTGDWQGSPSIAALPDGGAVVVWMSNDEGDSDTLNWAWRVMSQRYDAAGSPVGTEVEVGPRPRDVANSLEETNDGFFSYTRLPPSQWKSARTIRSIERLHEEFKGRSRPRLCCDQPIPQPCCSGRSWHRARSSCAKSMAGRPSRLNPPSGKLASPLKSLTSTYRRYRLGEVQPIPMRQR